jgi:GNAT superfamily N-acetyltransferase
MSGEPRDCTGFREDPALCEAFENLARTVFGIDFQPWRTLGYWSGDYVPHSLMIDGTMAANVSVNRMRLVLEGVETDGFQIGTVMTRPEFRGRGYARRLMEIALETIPHAAPVFLLANDSVMDFYPRFGFEPCPQHDFRFMLPHPYSSPGDGRVLDPHDPSDAAILLDLCARRVSVSHIFGARNAGYLAAFYALNGRQLRHVPEIDAILVTTQREDVLHIFDIIAPKTPSLYEILRHTPCERVGGIAIHFPPDRILPRCPAIEQADSELFVLHRGRFPKSPFCVPALLQA